MIKRKNSIAELAIFGGAPTFSNPRHVNRPNVAPRREFENLVDQAWDARWFTNDGPLVNKLETQLCDYLEVDNCVLMSNGTAALELTILALGLSGEIIIPSYTFISTAHTLSLMGIRPTFCDINPTDLNIDCNAVLKLINDKTSAVVATHVWGRACNVDRLQELCDEANIHLIFDSAHAFGSTYKRKRIGGFGVAEVFSLHATKVLHSFEGGFVSTNDSMLAKELRKLRNFGFVRFDEVETLGKNAKLSEIHAAMGLANLACIKQTIAANKRCHDKYIGVLRHIPGLRMHMPPDDEDFNFHYVVVEVLPEILGIKRDALVDILHQENILARRYFSPGGHRSLPYRTTTFEREPALPATDDICERILVLPAGAAIPDRDISAICDLLGFVAKNCTAICEMLHGPQTNYQNDR